MMLDKAIALVHGEELDLAAALRSAADAHAAEPDFAHLCRRFADQCQARAEGLAPFASTYGAGLGAAWTRRVRTSLVGAARLVLGKAISRTELAGVEKVLDLRRLHGMASRLAMDWVLMRQSGHAAHDAALRDYAESAEPEKAIQIRWLTTKLKESAPQVIVFS
jgi:hypothetical protein